MARRKVLAPLLSALLLLSLSGCCSGGVVPLAPPPTGAPLLEWASLGFLSDHHVGSAPTAHFGVRVRNAGGGELQLSFFVSSPSSRFFVVRPRDLVLQPGASRIVDIRAPLYLLDAESHFRENATATVQSNGGTASFSLTPEEWPEPPHGFKVVQMTNGNHAWHATPEDAGARLQLGGAAAVCGLLVLCLVARAARVHAHASLRAERRARKPPDNDAEAGLAAALAAAVARDFSSEEPGDMAGSDEDALVAVRAMQAREARAADKAAALEAWHAASAVPSGSSGGDWRDSSGAADVDPGSGSAGAASGLALAAPGAALCVVCLVRPRDTVCLPCRHVALCLSCARRLVQPVEDGSGGACGGISGASGGACPLCRGRLENYLQLYL